ncbi:MAG: pyridoxal phosphate-dependent aminotransferase [Acidobacteriota bacterium]
MTDKCDGSPDVHLNMNVRGLRVSATIGINERCDQLAKEDRPVYRLGLGQSPFPVPESVVLELQRNAFQKSYLPVKGLPALREAIAEHHQRTFGIKCSPDNVLVGPGSKELMFLLQMVYDGEVVIPTPAWVSYAPQAKIIGRQVKLVPTQPETGWRLTPDQLEEVCREDPGRPRILILNYPSNPTGGTYSSDELRDLAKVASRCRVVLLSDEIYAKLHHDGDHCSVVPFYPEGTIFSGGLSKWCGAGGWRLGLFVIPECMRWLLNAMAAVASETFTSTSAPIQYAAIQAFAGGNDIERYIRSCRRVLKPLGLRLVALLEESGIRVLHPAGGFYLFPDFSPLVEGLRRIGIDTSEALCERLLEETGVAILPGSDFGRPPHELTARLAYVDFDGAEALKAVDNLPEDQPAGDAFVDRYCRRTVQAIRDLCAWVVDNTQG